MRPSFNISRSLTSVNVKASIQGAMVARIVESRSGATLWTDTTQGSQPIAQASVDSSGPFGAGAQDPEIAEDKLIRGMAYRLTDDFRSRWVKQ